MPPNETSTRKGRTVYNSTKLHAKRDQRRFEANGRRLDYEKLTIKQRLQLAKSRRGESAREVSRLTVALTKSLKAAKK